MALASALKRNRTLRTLDVGDNQMGDQSATQLAQALKGTSSLVALQLQPLNALHAATPGLGHPCSISGFSAVTNILKGAKLPPTRGSSPPIAVLRKCCTGLEPPCPRGSTCSYLQGFGGTECR